MGVGIAQSVSRLGYGLDGARFGCQQTQEIFLFCKTSSLAPSRSQPLIQWVQIFFRDGKAAGA